MSRRMAATLLVALVGVIPARGTSHHVRRESHHSAAPRAPARSLVVAVAAEPGGDAGLVALLVGEYPEARRTGVADEGAPGLDGGMDTVLRLLRRHADVEVEPLPGRVVRIGVLEPQGG